MPTALPLDVAAPPLHPDRLSVHPEGTPPRRVAVPRSCRPPFPSTRAHPPSIPTALAFIPKAPPRDGYPFPVHADRPAPRRGRTHPRSRSPLRPSRDRPRSGLTRYPCRGAGLTWTGTPLALHADRVPVGRNPGTRASPPGLRGPEALPRLTRHRSPWIPIVSGFIPTASTCHPTGDPSDPMALAVTPGGVSPPGSLPSPCGYRVSGDSYSCRRARDRPRLHRKTCTRRSPRRPRSPRPPSAFVLTASTTTPDASQTVGEAGSLEESTGGPVDFV